MTPNTIGMIGLLVSVSAAIGLGVLIEHWRQDYKRRRRKTRHKFKPRQVPMQPEEWAVTADTSVFERACKKIVEENPWKFG